MYVSGFISALYAEKCMRIYILWAQVFTPTMYNQLWVTSGWVDEKTYWQHRVSTHTFGTSKGFCFISLSPYSDFSLATSAIMEVGLNRNFKKPINLTKDDETNFQNETYCHLCTKPFVSSDDKVRNHWHITSQYLGAAHKSVILIKKFRNTSRFLS